MKILHRLQMAWRALRANPLFIMTNPGVFVTIEAPGKGQHGTLPKSRSVTVIVDGGGGGNAKGAAS